MVKKKQKLTEIFIPKRNSKIPLKRSMTGYETELFILNSDGSIDHSDSLFKKARKAKIDVQKESTTCVIELSCLPSKRLKTTSQSLTDNLIALDELARKNDKLLFPFATYFGENNPVLRKNPHYRMINKIIGKDLFLGNEKCCGCHQHYELPRGLYDKKNQTIREFKNSKINKTLVDSYNLLVSLDPVLRTLSQSSPFVDKKYLAKDSRMLLLVGGKVLGYKGMYSKHRLFGALPPYKATVNDLIATQRRRYQKYKGLVKKAGYDPDKYVNNSMLKYAWNPVKINPLGTIEYRGYDMNFLSNLFGVATLFKFAMREIQQNFTMVAPLDIGVDEAFKVENKIIFIPPYSVVTKLQKKSAYKGMGDKDIRKYVKRFYNFAKSITNENYLPLIKPIKHMIDSEKTQSDRIIDHFRRKGFKDYIDQKTAQESAIKFADEFSKNLYNVKDETDKIEN